MKYALNTLPNDIHSLQEIILFLQNDAERIAQVNASLQQSHDTILQEKDAAHANLIALDIKCRPP